MTFRYADDSADLHATFPVISLSARDRVRQIRSNDRSMRPLSPEPGQSPADPSFAALASAFYSACQAFALAASDPALMLTFKLGPGDCVAFDNTRILHARTAFTGHGTRHLQGCYADLDGVASELGVLRRGSKGATI